MYESTEGGQERQGTSVLMLACLWLLVKLNVRSRPVLDQQHVAVLNHIVLAFRALFPGRRRG